jgi:hypothetical protein
MIFGIHLIVQFLVQDMAIEEKQSTQRLILDRSSKFIINGHLTEEGFNLWEANFLGMALEL